MTDWKQLARLRGIQLDESTLERVTKPLESLEPLFRASEKTIPLVTEPAVFYVLSEEYVLPEEKGAK